MHSYLISQNLNFKWDFNTHMRDKHGHLFLWDLELFWPLLKAGSDQGWKDALLSTFLKLSFESGFRYPFKR